jgi:hypothetical protein
MGTLWPACRSDFFPCPMLAWSAAFRRVGTCFTMICRARSVRNMNSLTIVILTGYETDCRLTEANNFLQQLSRRGKL